MERKKRSIGRGWESCYVKKILRDVWCRNESVRAEIGQMLHTHTHTHAAKLVVEIIFCFQSPHAVSFGVPKSDCIIRSKCLYNCIQYLIHLYSLSSYFSHLQTC